MKVIFKKKFKISILIIFTLFVNCSTTTGLINNKLSVYQKTSMIIDSRSKSITVSTQKFPILKTKSKYRLVARQKPKKNKLEYMIKIKSVSPYQIHYASARDLKGKGIKFVRHSRKKIVTLEEVNFLESFSLYLTRRYLNKNKNLGFKILLSGKSKFNYLAIEPQIIQGFLKAVDDKIPKYKKTKPKKKNPRRQRLNNKRVRNNVADYKKKNPRRQRFNNKRVRNNVADYKIKNPRRQRFNNKRVRNNVADYKIKNPRRQRFNNRVRNNELLGVNKDKNSRLKNTRIVNPRLRSNRIADSRAKNTRIVNPRLRNNRIARPRPINRDNGIIYDQVGSNQRVYRVIE